MVSRTKQKVTSEQTDIAFSGKLPTIFVINLEVSADRRQKMDEQLSRSGFPYQFFEAIDGHNLSPVDLLSYAGKHRRCFFGKDLTPGEIGCLLSHRSIYRHIIRNDIDTAIILEDDTILSDDFSIVIKSLLSLSIEWDLIRFLARPKVYKRTRILGNLTGKYYLGRPLGTPGGAYAYLISRRGAEALNKKMIHNWIPVDTLHGQVWRTHIKALSVTPSPVTYHEAGAVQSTIGAARFSKTHQLKGWERVVFPVARSGMKLYEMFWKNFTRIRTWPADKIYRLRNFSKRTTSNSD